METVTVFAWTATIITLLYTSLGLPSQIRKNAKSKSTEGLSLFMAVLLCATMTSWVVYGMLITNWFIVVPNSVGGVCSGVILIQIWKYNHSHNKSVS
ncbi:MAG: SemiSWEET family transporter [Phycisphaerales bacterium]|nr:SemiSWEET family transporter [Phycisphaerales bacterium]